MNAKAALAARIAGAALTVASLVFLVVSFLKLDFSGLPRLAGPFPWLSGLALAACYALTVGAQGLAWRSTLAFLAPSRPPAAPTLAVYARANIGKYLPGNVMHFIGRNYYGARLGLSQADMAFGTVLEIAALASTALFLAVLFGALSGSLGSSLALLIKTPYVPAAAGAVAALAALLSFLAIRFSLRVRRSLERIGARIAEATRRAATGPFRAGAPAYLLSVFSLYVVNFAIHSAVVVLAALVFIGEPLSTGTAVSLSASYIAAWLVGFIVPGAPGGLGVREAVFLLLSGSVLGRSGALALAAVSRAVCVAGDALAFAAALAVPIPSDRKA